MDDPKTTRPGTALSLSVAAAVLGQCILSGTLPPARQLFLQGLPMALGMVLLSAWLLAAETEAESFSGRTLRSRVLCALFAVWTGRELLATLWQAQTVCREQFSSMAILGILPLLLWAGWQLELPVFGRSAGVLWWVLALAALGALAALWGQFRWEDLQLQERRSEPLTLPLLPEFYLAPLAAGGLKQRSRRLLCRLPLLAFGILAACGLCRALLGAEAEFPQLRLGQLCRWDAVLLLAWLAAALFRAGLLIRILRELLQRTMHSAAEAAR